MTQTAGNKRPALSNFISPFALRLSSPCPKEWTKRACPGMEYPISRTAQPSQSLDAESKTPQIPTYVFLVELTTTRDGNEYYSPMCRGRVYLGGEAHDSSIHDGDSPKADGVRSSVLPCLCILLPNALSYNSHESIRASKALWLPRHAPFRGRKIWQCVKLGNCSLKTAIPQQEGTGIESALLFETSNKK